MRLSLAARAEVRPPLARDHAVSWRRKVATWLANGPGESTVSTGFDVWRPAAPRTAALGDARSAFRAAVEDIESAGACRNSIRCARSLHELWHLRAEIFNLVSRHHSQAEADRRLAQVDRHFPSRTRRAVSAAPAARDGNESVPPG
jgi:hypothetical protein